MMAEHTVMTVPMIKDLSLAELIGMGEFACSCGKTHAAGTKKVIVESGAVKKLPELIRECGAKKPFLLSGHDSFAAGGAAVTAVLDQAGIPYGSYVFPESPVKPTETAVGSAVMHFDYSCDIIIGIGSGVINDTGKILAHISGRPYIIVGTAPSMDGFASATSSMDRDSLKISLDSTFAYAVVGDVDILKNAPMHMLLSGVGDMLAKYISLAEWKMAHILVGDDYCPVIAALVENALDKVVSAAPKLLQRDEEAVRSVMEGMVIAGLAMKYAGLSRPASGMEHYFSHIWDMRSLAFPGAEAELHGIQCGIATLYSLKIYEVLRTIKPDKAKALAYAKQFDLDDWNRQLRAFVGPAAETMIRAEEKDGKYDTAKHAARLERILDKWDELKAIMDAMPSYEDVLQLMQELGAPVSASVIGYTADDVKTTMTMTKDIRDKYVLSRLLWDLGVTAKETDFFA